MSTDKKNGHMAENSRIDDRKATSNTKTVLLAAALGGLIGAALTAFIKFVQVL